MRQGSTTFFKDKLIKLFLATGSRKLGGFSHEGICWLPKNMYRSRWSQHQFGSSVTSPIAYFFPTFYSTTHSVFLFIFVFSESQNGCQSSKHHVFSDRIWRTEQQVTEEESCPYVTLSSHQSIGINLLIRNRDSKRSGQNKAEHCVMQSLETGDAGLLWKFCVLSPRMRLLLSRCSTRHRLHSQADLMVPDITPPPVIMSVILSY